MFQLARVSVNSDQQMKHTDPVMPRKHHDILNHQKSYFFQHLIPACIKKYKNLHYFIL